MITDWRDGQWRMRVRHVFDPDSISIYVHRRNGQAIEALSAGVDGRPLLHVLQDGDYADPAFRLDKEAAQELMDTLWAAGVRPVDGAGSAGQRAAMEHHLEDMRALVAHHAGVKLRDRGPS